MSPSGSVSRCPGRRRVGVLGDSETGCTLSPIRPGPAGGVAVAVRTRGVDRSEPVGVEFPITPQLGAGLARGNAIATGNRRSSLGLS